MERGILGPSFVLGITNPNRHWEDLEQITVACFIHCKPGIAGGIRLTNTSHRGQTIMPNISLDVPVAYAVVFICII